MDKRLQYAYKIKMIIEKYLHMEHFLNNLKQLLGIKKYIYKIEYLNNQVHYNLIIKL